ncbi:hypothetical protein PGT21_020541 [Puccinia graminis f. sp. tritici]|uniref:Complex III subunit 9 n=1 Tax=Puccinia graminis f. sp. tritici TaxID=56615 RepID=A0A5B0Q3J0_PUCGR|nr:hypothetical protein PGT21_020541 [Puccinia graminis f. sp. tritici]
MNISGSVARHGVLKWPTRSERGPDCPAARQALTRLQSKPTQASIQHSKMAITRMIYNSIMKRNSTYVSTIFAGSFIFSIGFDTLTSAWWEQHNKKKLWSTVRENLELK